MRGTCATCQLSAAIGSLPAATPWVSEPRAAERLTCPSLPSLLLPAVTAAFQAIGFDCLTNLKWNCETLIHESCTSRGRLRYYLLRGRRAMAALRAVPCTSASGASFCHEGGILYQRARGWSSVCGLQQFQQATSAAVAGRPSPIAAAAHIKRSSRLRLTSLNSSAGAGAISNWPEDSGVPGSSSHHESTDSSVGERHLEERATGNVSFIQVWCTPLIPRYDKHAKPLDDQSTCIINAAAS